ncbi:hypothetical protein F4780DRAFT_4950 [Xylariomycetidae sp. FL0641]|nr:hypothetical protein F4780DRAFT_4950 [Xylariomycetidae sp. FL0641]
MSRGTVSINSNHSESPVRQSMETASTRPPEPHDGGTFIEMVPTSTSALESESSPSTGNRRRVAHVLNAVGNWMATPARDRFDDSRFRGGLANTYPVIPGEIHRNGELAETQQRYNSGRDATPRPSRANSFSGSDARLGRITTLPSGLSPSSPSSPRSLRAPSPLRSSTLPVNQNRTSSDLPSPARGRQPIARPRRDTLTVPSPTYGHARHASSPEHPAAPITEIPTMPNSPSIVISTDPGPSSSHSPKIHSSPPGTP